MKNKDNHVWLDANIMEVPYQQIGTFHVKITTATYRTISQQATAQWYDL